MALIGIDLGTTNSLVSYWSEEGVVLIPNEFGEFLTPSIIGFDENKVSYVGKAAKEMIVTHPTTTFREIKRNMGTDKLYQVQDLTLRTEDLSALILKQLKQDAQNYIEEEVTEAIISVPAYFTDKQRSATRIAGELAGLKVNRLINEPSAAALAHRMDELEERKVYLVFDFGGGTLDISLVDAFENIVEIVGVSGNNHLGGKDFNEVIEACFYKDNQIKKEKFSLEWQEYIYQQAEKCKILLSTQEEVNQKIDVDGSSYTMHMTNNLLKKEAMPIFQQALECIQTLLSTAEMELEDIDKIILVGGSSKMPIVHWFLKSIFKNQEIKESKPDEIVALGAGVVAGIKERKANIKDMLLSDICPFSLGVEVLDQSFSTIIGKNEILPCSKVGYYTTVQDDQEKIHFDVYQGNQLVAKRNQLLTSIEIAVPKKKKGEAVVSIEFSYDINGIFQIKTTCMDDGKVTEKTLVNENSGMTQDEIQRRMAELDKINDANGMNFQNDYLVFRANRLFMTANKEQQQLILQELANYNDSKKQHLNKLQKREVYVRFTMILDMIESKTNQINASEFFDKD